MTTESCALWALTPDLPFLGPDDIRRSKIDGIENLSYSVSLAALPGPLDEDQAGRVHAALLGMSNAGA